MRDMPFERLVEVVPELVEARRAYAGASVADRRMSAQWAYDSAIAGDLFAKSVPHAGFAASVLEPGLVALAIDPLSAPALLTVGSLEYQFGRQEEALRLFLTLSTLPADEPDLAEILDKAGCFLLDRNDHPRATRLYRAATVAYPDVCGYWSSLSYCLGKAGQMEEAVATARKALALNGSDPLVLNDLGWTLMLASRLDEARHVFERAVALAPADCHLPRNNLRELEKRERGDRGS